MSTERVVTDNELICEFMGLRHRKEFGPLTGEEYTSVKLTDNANWLICHYDTSWDWLMPVVEKIESFGPCFTFRKSEITVYGWAKMVFGEAEKNEIYEDYDIGNSKIEVVYQSCVKFIKWYNSNGPIKENSPEDGVMKHE